MPTRNMKGKMEKKKTPYSFPKKRGKKKPTTENRNNSRKDTDLK